MAKAHRCYRISTWSHPARSSRPSSLPRPTQVILHKALIKCISQARAVRRDGVGYHGTVEEHTKVIRRASDAIIAGVPFAFGELGGELSSLGSTDSTQSQPEKSHSPIIGALQVI